MENSTRAEGKGSKLSGVIEIDEAQIRSHVGSARARAETHRTGEWPWTVQWAFLSLAEAARRVTRSPCDWRWSS